MEGKTMTDREKLVELIAEVAEADTIKMGGEWVEVINIDEIADHLLANGIEKVVYCDDCVNHGHCILENPFRLAGMQHPFCAAGKAREGDRNDLPGKVGGSDQQIV
jgi:hypothetical protein